jgi:hypothetical protein
MVDIANAVLVGGGVMSVAGVAGIITALAVGGSVICGLPWQAAKKLNATMSATASIPRQSVLMLTSPLAISLKFGGILNLDACCEAERIQIEIFF